MSTDTTNAFTYLSADGVTLWGVDSYVPSGAVPSGGFPVIVLAHGGQWDTNSKADIAAEGDYFAAAGFVCFAIDFTLAGGAVTVSQLMIDDVANAIAACRLQAGNYSGDRNRVAALGESSGGHLAYMVACTKSGTKRPDAVVGWSPVTRFETLTTAPVPFAAIKTYLNDSSPSTAKLQQFSPYNNITVACCPMRIAGSQSEQIPVGQFDDMAAAALAAGVPHVEATYPGGTHSHLSGLDGTATIAWLNANLPFVRTITDYGIGPIPVTWQPLG